jgi:hypothetical protein
VLRGCWRCESAAGGARLCSPSFPPAGSTGRTGTWGSTAPLSTRSAGGRRLPRRRRGLAEEAALEDSWSDRLSIVDGEIDHLPLPGAPTVVGPTVGV